MSTQSKTYAQLLEENDRLEQVEQALATERIWRRQVEHAAEQAIEQGIARQRRLEDALRVSQERLFLVARATNDALYDWDLRSGHTWSNTAFVEQFGIHPADVESDMRQWLARVHPDDHDAVPHSLDEALNGEADTWSAEYRFRRTDDSYAYVLDRLSIVRDESGKAVRMTGAMFDLTERRQTENALRASEEKFAKAFGLSPVMLAITSLADGRLLDVNQSLLDATGYAREDVLGRTPVALGWWAHPEERECGLAVLQQQGRLMNQEAVLCPRPGEARTCLYSAELIEINGKQCVLTAAVDITDRKRAEESLRYQKTLLEALTESVLDGILIVSAAGRILHFNQQFLDVWHFPEEVIQSRSDHSALEWAAGQTANPAEFRARVEAIYRQPDKAVREELVMKDGRVYERFGAPIYDGHTRLGWLWTFRDMTERKRAEQDAKFLADLGALFNRLSDPGELIEAATCAIGKYLGAARCVLEEIDLDRDIAFIEHDDSRGLTSLAGTRHTHTRFSAEDRASYIAGRVVVRHGVAESPMAGTTADQRAEPLGEAAMIGVPLLRDGQWVALCWVSSHQARTWTDAEVTVLRTAAERAWLALENARLHAETQALNATLEARVMQRTEALRHSQEQLRRLSAHVERTRESERSRIAREVHDELGSALTVLKMSLVRIRKHYDTDLKLTSAIWDVIEQTDSIVQTVRRIASDLRPSLLDDLGLLAALEWQAREFEKRSGITCQLDAPTQDWPLDTETRTAMFRVFQEALTNVARHAQATRVVASVRQAGGSIVLQVQDNGCGIDAEMLQSGRSFGLLGMHERIREINGKFEISGVAGGGTTVTIRVPLTSDAHSRDADGAGGAQ